MKLHTVKRTKHRIVFYESEFVHVMSSRVEGMVGERWINIRQLPLHSARLIRPKRWRVGSDSRSEPERRQRDRPIALMVAIKSAKPPRVSY